MILKNPVNNIVPNWAPYINTANVKENIDANEHLPSKKVSVEDSIMLTQEEFLDEFKNRDKASLIQFLKETKVIFDPKLSKEVLSNQIFNEIFDEEAFSKTFSIVFGGSGDWCCLRS